MFLAILIFSFYSVTNLLTPLDERVSSFWSSFSSKNHHILALGGRPCPWYRGGLGLSPKPPSYPNLTSSVLMSSSLNTREYTQRPHLLCPPSFANPSFALSFNPRQPCSLLPHSIDEIQRNHKKIQRDIECKRGELRVMVGERYRELIDTADTIAQMEATVESIRSTLDNVHRSCKLGT